MSKGYQTGIFVLPKQWSFCEHGYFSLNFCLTPPPRPTPYVCLYMYCLCVSTVPLFASFSLSVLKVSVSFPNYISILFLSLYPFLCTACFCIVSFVCLYRSLSPSFIIPLNIRKRCLCLLSLSRLGTCIRWLLGKGSRKKSYFLSGPITKRGRG